MNDPLPEDSLVELDYRTPATWIDLPKLRSERAFWFILWCWGMPLLIGLSTFLIWVVLRIDFLVLVGAVAIAFGTLAVFAGSIAAIYLLVSRWSRSESPIKDAVLPAALLIVLLLSNFAVARALIAIVGWIDPTLF